jgi:hypothetical protein
LDLAGVDFREDFGAEFRDEGDDGEGGGGEVLRFIHRVLVWCSIRRPTKRQDAKIEPARKSQVRDIATFYPEAVVRLAAYAFSPSAVASIRRPG